MSRKNLTRRTRLIPALGLVAALALPGAALARPARQAAAPWQPLWGWLVSWVTGIGGVGAPTAPALARPYSGSWQKAGATIDPDGARRGTLLETGPPVPGPMSTPTAGGAGTS